MAFLPPKSNPPHNQARLTFALIVGRSLLQVWTNFFSAHKTTTIFLTTHKSKWPMITFFQMFTYVDWGSAHGYPHFSLCSTFWCFSTAVAGAPQKSVTVSSALQTGNVRLFCITSCLHRLFTQSTTQVTTTPHALSPISISLHLYSQRQAASAHQQQSNELGAASA